MAASLFDSHCHLDFKNFDINREALWQRCQESNIRKLFIPGISPRQWLKAKAISESLPGCYFGIGLHPWWIEKTDLSTFEEQLSDAVKKLKPIAIGECGLDKSISTTIETQAAVLTAHINIANEHQLPLILHSVKSHEKLIDILKLYPVKQGGIIHAFSGSEQQAEQFINLGFLLGVGGTITYPRAKKTIAAIEAIELQYLVLETDAPDMPLYGFQGKDNNPLQLIAIAKRLAELKSVCLEEIIQITSNNSHRILNLNL